MKDKIEVGEYVRTKEWEIHKVIKIIEDDGDWDYYCCENNTGYFAMDIAKHSKNLMDLIEKGDIVNGHLVDEVRITSFGNSIFINDYKTELHEEDIEIILTKEEYLTRGYKVGGRNERI